MAFIEKFVVKVLSSWNLPVENLNQTLLCSTDELVVVHVFSVLLPTVELSEGNQCENLFQTECEKHLVMADAQLIATFQRW
jgi:hypothetical protein